MEEQEEGAPTCAVVASSYHFLGIVAVPLENVGQVLSITLVLPQLLDKRK